MIHRYRFISEHAGVYGVARLCRVLAVKRRQGYYEWLAAEPARQAREADDERLAGLILAIQAEHPGYGSPRISTELRRRGLAINRKRVERVMRERGIVGITRRRRRSLTKQDAKAAPAPDLIRRDFTAAAPGRRLVGDITYLPTAEGWLYLATTIDLFNREVIGHAMATHMRAELVCDAVELAHRRGLVGRRAIFHSDRGFNRSVHVHHVPDHADQAGHAALDGPDRLVFRQRGRRIVLRQPQSRDRHPRLRDPRRGPPRRVHLHQLLQQQKTAFHRESPNTTRSAYLLSSTHRPRGMKLRCPVPGWNFTRHQAGNQSGSSFNGTPGTVPQTARQPVHLPRRTIFLRLAGEVAPDSRRW